MSLLTIVQEVTKQLSLPTPAAVAASTDRQVIQLMSITNEEGKSLSKRKAWEALTDEQTFVTVAADVQPAALPDDFGRFIPDTFFNRSTMREIRGPLTSRQWQLLKARPFLSTVYLAYRERQGEFLFMPNAPAGQTIAYEYVSVNWAKGGAGVSQPAFQADTDTTFLDEDLIQLGLRWRYLKAKGLDYAEDMETYEREVEQAMGRDGGASMLSIAPQPVDSRINVPDGNFGGV